MESKFIYSFNEGTQDMKNLLGGKGANLGEMTSLGLRVPEGFTITTEACTRFFQEGEKLWDSLLKEVDESMLELEEQTNKKFGDNNNPLLVSVRSGSVISMPGMMDTILNLGLNDEAVQGLAKLTENEQFAYDSYRRFIQMFADVAMDIPLVRFDTALENKKAEANVENDSDLSAEDLKALVEEYKEIYKDEKGEDFPQDPKDQLHLAIEAVFSSWENPRAKVYRDLNAIAHDLGTAVNIQSMVFGNMGDTSGTGVAFTRNPATGENKLFGEYLINAQGEDVVAGIRTPEDINKLEEQMPEVFKEFVEGAERLEKHYGDMQDIEFTIEDKKLYFLQTRNGKRTAAASLKIAVEMVESGLTTEEKAIMSIEPNTLDQLLHPAFGPEAVKNAHVIGKGLAASPGAASGRIYFTAATIVEAVNRGENTILVRQETSPEDIEGMISAEGILTARGGMTSHAAVVARGMGKCCVAGASNIDINEAGKYIIADGERYEEGDFISINGTTGEVYQGEVEKTEPELSENFEAFMDMIDRHKRLGVRANADTAKEIKQAVEFGGQGVGLTRTEHMFFDTERLPSVRRFILSASDDERVKALENLLEVQRDDFKELFKAIGELPITIRLLDPPLHEFLPHSEAEKDSVAEMMEIDREELDNRILSLQELNPMLGHRGCRLAVTYPELYNMQARAIIEACMEVIDEDKIDRIPEIMIPLVGEKKELEFVKENVVAEINKVFEEKAKEIDYLIGTMIEIPRACLLSDEIAEEAEFFSFGTNDLTQMGFGFSRDDAGNFLMEYVEKEIFEDDPFQSIDQKGIGRLMEISVELGRKTRPDIQLGICGEHGGEPKSVRFCHEIGLDYVSCSPFRIPIAKLAAAQAAIEDK